MFHCMCLSLFTSVHVLFLWLAVGMGCFLPSPDSEPGTWDSGVGFQSLFVLWWHQTLPCVMGAAAYTVSCPSWRFLPCMLLPGTMGLNLCPGSRKRLLSLLKRWESFTSFPEAMGFCCVSVTNLTLLVSRRKNSGKQRFASSLQKPQSPYPPACISRSGSLSGEVCLPSEISPECPLDLQEKRLLVCKPLCVWSPNIPAWPAGSLDQALKTSGAFLWPSCGLLPILWQRWNSGVQSLLGRPGPLWNSVYLVALRWAQENVWFCSWPGLSCC